MTDNVISFTSAKDPGRRRIRADVLLSTVQHYAFVDVDPELVSRLMEAATVALTHQAMWIEINAGDCRRLRNINFSKLDKMLLADLERQQE